MAICNDQKAEEQQFDVKVMRPHLLGCLKDKQMRHFPGKIRHLQSDVSREIITERVRYSVCADFQKSGIWFAATNGFTIIV